MIENHEHARRTARLAQVRLIERLQAMGVVLPESVTGTEVSKIALHAERDVRGGTLHTGGVRP